jgi:hypothetical protein
MAQTASQVAVCAKGLMQSHEGMWEGGGSVVSCMPQRKESL